MKITTAISIRVVGGVAATRAGVRAIALGAVLRFSAALADRLVEEGIQDVELAVQGDR